MTPKRIFAALTGLLLALPVAAAPLTPTAELTDFKLQAISLHDVTFEFELSVKNPYPVGLSFSGMSLDFAVEGHNVFKTKSRGGFKVPGNKTGKNRFKVTLAYDDIFAVVKDYASKDTLDTTVSGKLSIPLPKLPGLPGSADFSYKVSQRIPAIKPEVEIRGFSVDPPDAKAIARALAKASSKVKPKDAEDYFRDLAKGKKPKNAPLKPRDIDVPFSVSFTLALSNKAKAPLGLEAMDYTLEIDGDTLVQGKATDVVRKGDTTMVTIRSEFSSKSLSDRIQSMLGARKGKFRISGSTSLVVPREISKTPLPLAFDEKGSFSF